MCRSLETYIREEVEHNPTLSIAIAIAQYDEDRKCAQHTEPPTPEELTKLNMKGNIMRKTIKLIFAGIIALTLAVVGISVTAPKASAAYDMTICVSSLSHSGVEAVASEKDGGSKQWLGDGECTWYDIYDEDDNARMGVF